MDQQQKGILTLIRSAVTGQAFPLPEGFALTDAMPQILRHNLTPLACEGALNCGLPMSSPAMSALLSGYGKALQHSEGQRMALEKVFAAFEEKGIDYLPVKGAVMKPLYPRPELRLMGDADILVRTEQYRLIEPIMTSLGFTFVTESDHEYIWDSELLQVELHKRLIPSYNRDYYAYFGDGWRLAIPDRGSRYTMSPENQFIYLFTHFAKHYRDGGIGCRHVTDLWVFLREFPELDLAAVRAELRKLQLLEFFENILSLIGVWFEDAAPTERTEFITAFLFRSGSWGDHETHALSQMVRHSRGAGSVKGGQFRSFLQLLFPGVKALSQRYPTLRRLPWLLPVFWVVRWVETLLFRRDSIQKKRGDWKLTTADRIETHQQALQFVGLDFRFEE